MPPTQKKIKPVTKIKNLIFLFCYQTLYFSNFIYLPKMIKADRFTLAGQFVLNYIYTDLLTANTRKKITSSTYLYLIQ